ncbi:MAG: N-acetyltransferase [Desulfobacterales bacterium]|jgi:amino-acid N-acetyltransferase
MIRKATIKDVKAIHVLLQEYGKKEELLARPLSELYDHVRDFWVYVDDRKQNMIGCSALQFCWEDLAEIRSLAVHPDHLGKNIGTELAKAVLTEAKSFDVRKIFTLTYKPDFFKQLGFVQIERSDLPLKIWGDCMICVKFPDCDEIAMMKDL